MAFGLSTDEVVDFLSRVGRYDPLHRAKLLARLKHFQRLGFPRGVNTGRGRAASYGAKELVELVLAITMLDVGFTPERIVDLLEDQQGLTAAVARALREKTYLLLFPRAMAVYEASQEDASSRPHRLRTAGVDELSVLLSEGIGRPGALVDLTSSLNRLSQELSAKQRAQFSEAIETWIQEMG